MEGWGVKREPKKDTVAVHAPPPSNTAPHGVASDVLLPHVCHLQLDPLGLQDPQCSLLSLRCPGPQHVLEQVPAGCRDTGQGAGLGGVCVRVEGLCTHMCVLVRASVQL